MFTQLLDIVISGTIYGSILVFPVLFICHCFTTVKPNTLKPTMNQATNIAKRLPSNPGFAKVKPSAQFKTVEPMKLDIPEVTGIVSEVSTVLTRVHQKPAEAYNRQPAITIQVKPISTEVVPSTPEPTDYYLRDYLKEHGVKGVNKRWSRETLLRKYKEIA